MNNVKCPEAGNYEGLLMIFFQSCMMQRWAGTTA